MDLNDMPPPPPQQLSHKQLKALAHASRPWYRKKRFWAAGVIVLLIIAAGSGSGSTDKDKDALPAGSDNFPTSTTVQAGTVEEVSAPAAVVTTTSAAPTTTTRPPVTTTTAPAVQASSCDVAREALLTGSPAEINASMRALMADKSADATAREYADYYLNRDAGQPDMQQMDISIIRMYCSM